jgi:hypothetical protein
MLVCWMMRFCERGCSCFTHFSLSLTFGYFLFIGVITFFSFLLIFLSISLRYGHGTAWCLGIAFLYFVGHF